MKWIEKLKHNHGLMMALCCGVPLILLLVAVSYFGLSRSYLTWFIFLLCPIMHIFMMRGMHKGHKEEASDDEEDSREPDKKEKGGCH